MRKANAEPGGAAPGGLKSGATEAVSAVAAPAAGASGATTATAAATGGLIRRYAQNPALAIAAITHKLVSASRAL